MSDASITLYKNGSLAFKEARYDEAITCLERFCKETVNRQSKQFLQAQMWLIQAYHRDHQDLHAMALCEQLAKSEVPQVKQWADRALTKLMNATPAPSTESESVPPSTPQSATYKRPENFSTLTAAATPVGNDSIAQAAPHRTASTGRSASRLSTRHITGHRSRRTSSAQPKDYTNQVMAAIAHGSISVLASILLFVLFSDSLAANTLGLARFVVPLLIFLNTNDEAIKANAREALNYVLTCLILVVPFWLAIVFLVFIFIAAWPVAVLLGLMLGGYLIVLSVYPVVATIVCLTKEGRVFRYPNWLIWHLI